ncbi:hypothetical protein H6P81_001543 [Aristolochia fimbriata]|uniref:Uncharacterized protein n=1 Tax=Aristolochia fimbriata TaxID=158543 RepID=A0AAV7F766_ARIFI|nr:hypothetical protein H6P81_001543 [Aristolochia fimbriata]
MAVISRCCSFILADVSRHGCLASEKFVHGSTQSQTKSRDPIPFLHRERRWSKHSSYELHGSGLMLSERGTTRSTYGFRGRTCGGPGGSVPKSIRQHTRTATNRGCDYGDWRAKSNCLFESSVILHRPTWVVIFSEAVLQWNPSWNSESPDTAKHLHGIFIEG